MDFSTTPPLMTWTEVKATTNLAQTAFYTDAVPTGSGQAPFENYATGVQFIVEPTLDDAIGDMTIVFQAAYDTGGTWFPLELPSFTGTIPAADQAMRFHVPVNSRQFRYVRMGISVATAPSGSPSTARVLARTVGITQAYTKSGNYA